MPPAIPDRWLDYTPVGQTIRGTRFIAFKVPLRTRVNKEVPPHQQLSCTLLLKTVPSLGMIIDLTNTTRYYDPSFFKSQGIEYAKLMVPGHQVPPSHCVQRFKMLVKNFLQENANNSKLIGVHCTHGVNRTGYLISSFMISEMDISPQEAIKSVEEARGHGIERNNYRDHLMGVEILNSGTSEPNYHKWRRRERQSSNSTEPAFNNWRRSDFSSNRTVRNNVNNYSRRERDRHLNTTDKNYNSSPFNQRYQQQNTNWRTLSTYRSQSDWGREPLPNSDANRFRMKKKQS